MITKKYTGSFAKNEKTLRNFLKGNHEDALLKFKENEQILIDKLLIELQNDENKIIFNMMNEIDVPELLFFRDYITF